MNCFDLLNKETSHLVSKSQFILELWKRNLMILFQEPLCSEKKMILAIKDVPINKVVPWLSDALSRSDSSLL